MFLNVVEKLMDEHGLTRGSLSKNTGIPYTTIVGWWSRGYDNVSMSSLVKLSNYFNVSVDYLIYGDESGFSEELAKAYFNADEQKKQIVNLTLGISDDEGGDAK